VGLFGSLVGVELLVGTLQYFVPGVVAALNPDLEQQILATPLQVPPTTSGILVLLPIGKGALAEKALAHNPERYMYDGRFLTNQGTFLSVFNIR
jgi:hypothetical protein